jgi:uncharacterized membrane protein YoaK (UPF0700 family)
MSEGFQPHPAALEMDSLRVRAAGSVKHPLTRALLALTFTSGLVDAISFLALGNVFTANMTGNVVFLGFGIAGRLDVVGPLVSVGFFLVGAVGGGIVARRFATEHPAHVGAALGLEAALIGTAATLAAALDVLPHSTSANVLVALLALAMGVRNVTTLRVGVQDMSTTVVTTLMASLAADSPLAGGSGRSTVRRVTAVLAMLAGAAAGALLLEVSLVAALAAASGLALSTGILYVRAARRETAR